MSGSRKVVALMRQTKIGTDALNAEQYEWRALCKALAEKHDVKDAEKQDAGREVSEHVARFVLRSVQMQRFDISNVDRLRGFGTDWEILGLKDAPRFGRNAIEITAKKITVKLT